VPFVDLFTTLSDCMGLSSNWLMNANYEMDRMWKEPAVAYCEGSIIIWRDRHSNVARDDRPPAPESKPDPRSTKGCRLFCVLGVIRLNAVS
jgi:hypothetical protein